MHENAEEKKKFVKKKCRWEKSIVGMEGARVQRKNCRKKPL